MPERSKVIVYDVRRYTSAVLYLYWIYTAEITGSIPSLVQAQATSSKLLTYCMLRPT